MMNVIEMSGTHNEGQRASRSRNASRSTGRSMAPAVTSCPIVEQKQNNVVLHKWNVHGESFELDGRYR
jgi:hypothetical protein